MTARDTAREALERLVRAAMGAGIACFMDRLRSGEVDPHAPLPEAFGDFPAEFLRLRRYLVDDALNAIVAERVTALAEDEAMVERINRSSLDYSTLFAGRAPLEIVAVLRALAAALIERDQS